MKPLMIFCAALLGTAPAAAQQADSVLFEKSPTTTLQADTTLQWQQTTDGGLATLHAGDKPGTMAIDVAGFSLTLSSVPPKTPSKSRASLGVLGYTEAGFTQLTGLNYASGYNGFLDQQLGPSFHFSFSIVSLDVWLNKRHSLQIGFGLQYSLDNFRLTDRSITVGNSDGQLVPVPLGKTVKKSKLVTSSLGIPVRLTYSPVKNLKITATAYSDFLLGADAIWKKPKNKNGLSGFSSYQFGAGLAVTYHHTGLFVRYGVTPFFKKSTGLDGHTLSFGLAFGW